MDSCPFSPIVLVIWQCRCWQRRRARAVLILESDLEAGRMCLGRSMRALALVTRCLNKTHRSCLIWTNPADCSLHLLFCNSQIPPQSLFFHAAATSSSLDWFLSSEYPRLRLALHQMQLPISTIANIPA